MFAYDFAQAEEYLRSLGYSTTRDQHRLIVELPLWCSVEVDRDGESLHFTPKFGFARRSTATYGILLIGLCAPLPLLFSGNSLSFSFGCMFFALCALVWDVFRYILTENMITRLQQFLLSEGRAA